MGGALRWGPRRAVRVAVAIALTLLTAAYVGTMVAAVVGERNAGLASPFFYTGVLVLLLGWASVVAWRWVARATHEQSEHLRVGISDEPEPRDHLGLNGEIEPPTRW